MKGKDQSMKKILSFLVLLVFVTVAGYCENETFVIKEIDLEMVKCPAGSFIMGSPDKEYSEVKTAWESNGCEYDEKQHKVSITKPFFIGKYEVTQNQFVSVMGITLKQSSFTNPKFPILEVTWEYAKRFCDRLNLKYLKILPEGYKFDLPTEAQWEYACRAGTNNALNNGKELTTSYDYCPNLDEVAWYSKNSNQIIHIIGQKKPNSWGIYDMHGNAWEWCEDWFGSYPDKDVIDPRGVKNGSSRICRGGGFESLSIFCRSANRRMVEPSNMELSVGFRVALVPIVHSNGLDSCSENKGQNDSQLPNSLIIKEINLETVLCPAGSFLMGSPRNEIGRTNHEELHKVTITKPFYIGKYEITQAQYKNIMGKNPSIFKFEKDEYPVESVIWEDAKKYCDKLNNKYSEILPKGYKFDLPTEAQWEYACRAGTNTSFNNGNNLRSISKYHSGLELQDVAWYNDLENSSIKPIGQKKPNAWGIYDMHGNVAEWCRDGYGEYPNSDVTDPIGSYDVTFRVFRGGGWHSYAQSCRSAHRNGLRPDLKGYITSNIGFRIAIVPVE